MFTSRSTPARPSWAIHAVSGPSAPSSAGGPTGISAATLNDSPTIRAITWLIRIRRSVVFTYITNSTRLSMTMASVSSDWIRGTEDTRRGSGSLS